MFIINGKEYAIPELTYNTIADLDEKYGLNLFGGLDGISPFSIARSFFALCTRNKEIAGNELQEHLLNGGSFDELLDDVQKAMENSGFLSGMRKKSELEEKKKKASKSLKTSPPLVEAVE